MYCYQGSSSLPGQGPVTAVTPTGGSCEQICARRPPERQIGAFLWGHLPAIASMTYLLLGEGNLTLNVCDWVKLQLCELPFPGYVYAHDLWNERCSHQQNLINWSRLIQCAYATSIATKASSHPLSRQSFLMPANLGPQWATAEQTSGKPRNKQTK